MAFKCYIWLNICNALKIFLKQNRSIERNIKYSTGFKKNNIPRDHI